MMAGNPLISFFSEYGLLILDGGLATELEAYGHDLSDELWSARLLMDDPAAIRRVHTDYLEAGADCIISASYQATIAGFMNKGLSRQKAEELLRLSVQLALEARDEFWDNRVHHSDRHKPIVAASIGPYGAALADGSEYTGDYDLDLEGLLSFHQQRWHILAETGADIMACETIPSRLESEALAQLLPQTPGRYAWFSFSCRDDKRLRDGSLLKDCVAPLDQIEQVAAVGINCSWPRYVHGLISECRQVTNKPIIVYPNSGEEFDAQEKRWTGVADSVDFASASEDWCAAGAKLVGGCCRTGPEHIRQIRQRLLSSRIH